MHFKRIFSIIVGFGTIGLLSSLFAKLQGAIFPASLKLFELDTWTSYDVIQLVIKLVCFYMSCIVGGMVTSLCGGKNKQQYITGMCISFVVIWLWISTINPTWFWALALSGIIPFIQVGKKLKPLLYDAISSSSDCP